MSGAAGWSARRIILQADKDTLCRVINKLPDQVPSGEGGVAISFTCTAFATISTV